ncbi:MAG: hypothetical protein C0601_06510 [Candidatus Muiribacterium halophilum]|uniref:Amidohydrolase-related domain-containing protein n=1 Tax=Muiribacterium halophilum TaxID=2053465 RepID=A0A2N5ZG47_MUIH1|nr:MAG: hypothetical protein C0601_06510 [Candidatus Muirbacterium halophilum]
MKEKKLQIIVVACFVLVISGIVFLKTDFSNDEHYSDIINDNLYNSGEGLIAITGFICDYDEVLPNGGIIVRGSDIIWEGEGKDLLDIKDKLSSMKLLQTDDFIYPGLIDSHNHPDYNFLPKWKPQQLFNNRYEWASKTSYKKFMDPKRDLQKKRGFNVFFPKLAEVKDLLNGTTMTQGARRLSALSGLVRNCDSYNGVKDDFISTSIKPLGGRELKRVDEIIENLDSGKVRKHIVHLAEGKDEESRQEFYEMQKLGLIRKELVIIHGTALKDKEFKKMSEIKIPLIWSPRSNMVLYGETTRVDKAINDGVKVALAPDWSLTGSENIREELDYAIKVNKEQLNSFFTDIQLFGMITKVPADILGFGDYLGLIEPGMKADIIITDKKLPDNPYKNIGMIKEKEINLVMINGRVYYGEPDYVSSLADPVKFEKIKVEGQNKLIDIAEDEKIYPYATQTFKQLMQEFKDAGYSKDILRIKVEF